MRLKLFLLAVLVAFLVFGCGYREGVTIKDEMSYVEFTGNWQNVTIQIDNAEPFNLKGRSPVLKYGLSPGTHEIKVYRDERLLLNRVIFLGNRQTTEIRIP